jgi:hypothetical protein
VTQEHLGEETPKFIIKVPGLNPMDYAMWDSLSEKVYDIIPAGQRSLLSRNLRTKSRKSGQKYI